MGLIVYNLSIFLYRLTIKAVAPFNEKANAFLSGRKNLLKTIKNDFASKKGTPVAWFHCASLGEFEQGRPVIEMFKTTFPQYTILLTFFSPSGYEVRKNYSGADHIYYLPFDTKNNANTFINITKPDIAFFIKYEFWYHYTKALRQHDIPLLSVSTTFRSDQPFFQFYGTLHRQMLKNFSHFFVQDQKSIELLKNIGLNNASLSGDTRFDRVNSLCKNAKEIHIAKAFKGKHQIMVVGSSWNADINVLAPFINQNEYLKFIIAPHEINQANLEHIEKSLNKRSIRHSQVTSEDKLDEYDVLMIDNIGMLSALYQYADFAYIGGAFGAGLHNILEPATFGIPIFFGNKNYRKFHEAISLIKLNVAYAIGSYSELISKFEDVQRNYDNIDTKNITSNFVLLNTGATDKIITYCKPLIAK